MQALITALDRNLVCLFSYNLTTTTVARLMAGLATLCISSIGQYNQVPDAV